MLYAFLVGCSIATCEFAVSCVSMNVRKGRLAQWWRRCLTSTRSLVRTQYRPPAVSAGQRLKSFWPASFLSPKTEKCAASVPKVCKLFWKSPKSTFCGRYVDEHVGGASLVLKTIRKKDRTADRCITPLSRCDWVGPDHYECAAASFSSTASAMNAFNVC